MNNLELQIKLYDEQMLINSFVNNGIIKNADFFDSIKTYFSNQIDPNDKWRSISGLITPGSIMMLLSRTNHPILGTLAGVAISAFDINLVDIYRKIYDKVKDLIRNKNLNQSSIDDVVESVIKSENTEVSPEQEKKLLSLSLHDINEFKKIAANYSMIISDPVNAAFVKYKYAGRASNTKFKLLMFIGSVFKNILLAAFAALGINLAVNSVKKVMNKPNAFDGPTYNDQIKETQNIGKTTHISSQKVFPVKSSYSESMYNGKGVNWIENYSNSSSGINKLLLDFAKTVYDGLDNMDSKIMSTRTFQAVQDRFEDYNINAVGDNVVFIPKEYKSKKQVVDEFIDDVAKNIPQQNKNVSDLGPIPKNDLVVS